MKFKKLVSLILTIGIFAALNVPAMAQDASDLDVEKNEMVLELDESGRAGITIGIIVYDDHTESFDLQIPEQEHIFSVLQEEIASDKSKTNALTPKSSVIFHVGIEMTGNTDEYRMYYDIDGIGLTAASGYMKCKSTALLFPTTYHDEFFSARSLGTTYMSGESDEFTLPSGTSKVKVGWHGVSVTYADGTVNADDKYKTVNVG